MDRKKHLTIASIGHHSNGLSPQVISLEATLKNTILTQTDTMEFHNKFKTVGINHSRGPRV